MKELELLTILTNVRSEYILQAQQLRAGSQKQLRLLHKKRILLIAALRDCMKIDQIAALMQMVNGNVEDVRDDIISEAKLYDYLCETVRQLDLQHHSREEIEAVIQRVTADYEGPSADAAGRLNAALLIMVCAYISGVLKKEAELYFEQMKLGGI